MIVKITDGEYDCKCKTFKMSSPYFIKEGDAYNHLDYNKRMAELLRAAANWIENAKEIGCIDGLTINHSTICGDDNIDAIAFGESLSVVELIIYYIKSEDE